MTSSSATSAQGCGVVLGRTKDIRTAKTKAEKSRAAIGAQTKVDECHDWFRTVALSSDKRAGLNGLRDALDAHTGEPNPYLVNLDD